MKPAPDVKCPTCGKVGPWFEGAFGPFCSKRCKLVDLGKWLGEEHRISESLRPEHFQGYDTLPNGADLDQAEAEEAE
jgi:endogenous inhibitor of DNA gyrase (YacG/DUF329 family)